MKAFIYTIVCLLGMVSVGQAQTSTQSYKGVVAVKENKTERTDNRLLLQMEVSLCGLSVGRYNSLELSFMLCNGKDSLLLQPIVLNGANKQKMYNRALSLKGREYANGGAYVVLKSDPALLQEITYEQTIPFHSWMADAELVLLGKVMNYEGALQHKYTDVLTNCLNVE